MSINPEKWLDIKQYLTDLKRMHTVKEILSAGYGMTPTRPAVALVSIKLHRVQGSEKSMVTDFDDQTVYVNLQLCEEHSLLKEVQSMVPGEKALVYSFFSQKNLRAYKDGEAFTSQGSSEEAKYDGYVAEVCMVEWSPVEELIIDEESYYYKETVNIVDASLRGNIPKLGDCVSVEIIIESLNGREESCLEAQKLCCGNLGGNTCSLIRRMSIGEKARFFRYERKSELSPTHISTIFLQSHTPLEQTPLNTQELLDVADLGRTEGNSLFRDQRFIQAEEMYFDALDILNNVKVSPDIQERHCRLSIVLHVNLSRTFLLEKNWDRAVEFANKSISIDENATTNIKAYVCRSEARLAMNECKEAIRDLEKASASNPSNRYVSRLLERAQRKKDQRKAKAKRIYEELLEQSNVCSRRYGVVRTWRADRKFGFIRDNDDGREYFFHANEVNVRKLPVRLTQWEEVSFDPLFDKSDRLGARNVAAPDGSPLQGSDDPLTAREKNAFNHQIRKEVLKVDFEEAHFKEFISNAGSITPAHGTVKEWDHDQGEGMIVDSAGVSYFFKAGDVSDDFEVRKGIDVSFGSLDLAGLNMKRAVDIERSKMRTMEAPQGDLRFEGLLDTRYCGECVSWNSMRSFGFIKSPSLDKDVFVHKSGIEKSIEDEKSLYVGEKVEFDVKVSSDGRKKAIAVTGPRGEPVQGHKKIGRCSSTTAE